MKTNISAEGGSASGGKKTLLITYFFPPAIGGIENYFNSICSRLDPANIVVLAENHPEAAEFDGRQKYKVIRTEFFGGKIPPRWTPLKEQIRKIIKSEKIEQIIFGHFHPLCLLGGKLGLPYFIFGHGTDITQIGNDIWQVRALKKSYRNPLCKKFIANSKFIFDELSRLLGDKSKLEIIYPGVDFKALNDPAEDFAARKEVMGLGGNDIILLSMGRVEPEKNFGSVIKLMPEMLLKIPKLKYVIVGGGSDLQNLKDLAQSEDLKYNVIFTGPVKDDASAKAFYFQLAHIYITASTKPEGFGISYLEAAAAKTVIIASEFGGSSEAVKDNETGLLIDPNKPEEIRDAIYKLALNRELWEKMSSSGQVWAKQFDWGLQMEKINNLVK